MGGQRRLCGSRREAQPVQCPGMPLPRRQGRGRGRGVSWEAPRVALQRISGLSRPGLYMERTRRAWLDNPVLWAFCLQSHVPFCFPRPWELLLCSSCAAEGTHRRCSGLTNCTESWECDNCARLGTCMRKSTWVLLGWGWCPGWDWQSLSAPGELGVQLWPGLPWAWGASDIPACPYSLQG